MGARHKLNEAHFLGAVLWAGVIGAVTGSWIVFFIALGILLALSIHGGAIRFGRPRW
jgi:hypothetical protein